MFQNRSEAGKQLAEQIKQEFGENSSSFVVLAIPRGGVAVGWKLVREINAQLDIIVTKKIGAPKQKELALGAVGQTEGSVYLDERIIGELGVPSQYIDQEVEKMQIEIARREALYRNGKPEIDLKDKRVILTDDGAATGATMVAAAREVWNRQPKQVIIALPVCSKNTRLILEEECDTLFVLETPDDFFAVGQFYTNFEQISDSEVVDLLSN